jgi:phosphomannomutase / phosphoglucomutase
MSIYRACDIRGRADTELTPELYSRWGRALGSRVGANAKFVAGGDHRASTPGYLSALMDGLCDAGLDVVDLGSLPTPMIHYARDRLQAAGCAIVTGSRNPPGVNGLKWMIGDQSPAPEEVEMLRESAEAADSPPTGRTRTSPRPLDVSFDYVAALQETWVDSLQANLRVAIDPMHGSFAATARRYLQAIFPQCLFHTIHDTPAADFAGAAPDCTQASRLDELCQTVFRERADFGAAFDGDGDRVALVDDEGMVLTPEEATWVMLQMLGPRLCGEKVICDVKFSDRIGETARSLGAEAIPERSGHAYIRARMRQTQAIFGAELSGHYFFREMDGCADALYAVCWVIAYLARTGESLANLRRECPPIHITPDLRLPLEYAMQQDVISRIRSAWANYPRRTIDGLRIDTPSGWFLVRPSVTEPALTFRFESDDWTALDELVDRFCNSLGEVGDRLWADYGAAMGGAG